MSEDKGPQAVVETKTGPYVLEDTTIFVKREPWALEFFAYEYMGYEVCLAPGTEKIDFSKLEPVKTRDGLKEGDTVVFPHPMAGTPWYFSVLKFSDGMLYLQNSDTVGSLDFDTDDRHCWVCGSFGNTKGLDRVDFS